MLRRGYPFAHLHAVNLILFFIFIFQVGFVHTATAMVVTVPSGTVASDYVFIEGETYHVSASTVFTGNVTFEGGAVVKFDSTGSVEVQTTPVFQSHAGSPVIFTSSNDDSVGEAIPGSTGTPTYYSNALTINSGTIRFAEFRYATEAISFTGNGTITIQDSRFFATGTAVDAQSNTGAATLTLKNILIADGTDGIVSDDALANGLDVIASHLTVSNLSGKAFNSSLGHIDSDLSVTDSLFADVGAVFSGTGPDTEDYNAFYNSGSGTGTNNVALTTNPILTDYFLDQASTVINAGSQTATNAGLYHYTTDSNKTIEAVSQVDIGYHMPPKVIDFSVMATNSIWMKSHSMVSGDIGVNVATAGPYLDSNVALSVGHDMVIPSAIDLRADSIKVKTGAVVDGKVYHNQLENNGTINGSTVTPLAFPILDVLPLFRSATLGIVSDINVPAGTVHVLAPGDYGIITVNDNATLQFTGGLYLIQKIDAKKTTSLLFDAPSEVRIKENLVTKRFSTLAPSTGVTLSAADIQFFVEGADVGSVLAVEFGHTHTVKGHFYAPNGTLSLKRNSTFSGIFLAKDIMVGHDAQIELDPGTGQPIVATPVINPAGGSFLDSVTVSLSTITSGATIHFTTDGSTPTAASPVYTAPFILDTLGSPHTVKAIAIRANYLDSGISTAVFTVTPTPTVDPVTASPDHNTGPFQDTVDVTLSTPTAGATIHYTIDGTAPTTSSSVYTTPITLTTTGSPHTVQAFAVKAGHNDSSVSVFIYVVETSQTVPGEIPDAPLDDSLVYNVPSNTEFLYTGASPPQTGVTPGTIDPLQSGVIRGQVLDTALSGLAGVTVTVSHHPEYGSTLTRSDGFYDLVVNGSEVLHLEFNKTGMLTAQRRVETPVNDFKFMDEVVLVASDPLETTLDLTQVTPPPFHVAQGSVVDSGLGTERKAVLMIPSGITPTMVVAGATQSFSSLNAFKVRLTEYSEGQNGPESMPAVQPVSNAYTYALEMSVEEARNADAERVNLNGVGRLYLKNFLSFPNALPLTVGFYNSHSNRWEYDSQTLFNGQVLKVISSTSDPGGDLANLDLDGDGDSDPDDAALYSPFQITDDERREVLGQFAVGDELWRVRVEGLSPYSIAVQFSVAEVAP